MTGTQTPFPISFILSRRVPCFRLKPLGKPIARWSSGTGSADFKKTIAALFNAAGLHDARSHDLRRTFGSIAADEGYGDSTISELLGHARRGVTARHYIRRTDA